MMCNSYGLYDYLDRKNREKQLYNLDQYFFSDLNHWITQLDERIEFQMNSHKMELIISLLNKFLFIQTLDDHYTIESRWLKKTWDYFDNRWFVKGKSKVITKFLEELVTWFYAYYDTELFEANELDSIVDDTDNLDKLYDELKIILGINYWDSPMGQSKGIIQYNFRYIDEDIFGKAYEAFLANVRHDQGIYYTPKYITEYIVKKTTEEIVDNTSHILTNAIENENFELALEHCKKFVSIKIIDPACGSGSFLVKAARKMLKTYLDLDKLIKEKENQYNESYSRTIRMPEETQAKLLHLSELKELLSYDDKRRLVSSILVRHIYGVDLDQRALGVAKVNLWLECIKQAGHSFQYTKLPDTTEGILPNLEQNIVNGNSLIGLPDEHASSVLAQHKDTIIELHTLRQSYLNDFKQAKVY